MLNNLKNRFNAKKKLSILIISLALLCMAGIGGTLAYLLDATDPVVNTFTPAKVDITIYESKDETTKSDIKITNSSDNDAVTAFVRAKLVTYWTDIVDGKETVIPAPSEDIAKKAGGELITANGWFEVNGIYYYDSPVAPGASTKVMANPITITLSAGSTIKCYIDVLAEAIQAEPTTAVEESWLDVNVSNGKLVPANTN